MNKHYISKTYPKVEPPKKVDVMTIRFLIGCGLISMIIFVMWFATPDHVGYPPIYWLLTFALLFKLVKMIHEWYHYWSLSVPVAPEWKTKWTVDVLTTACPGEPKEMIIDTLKAMVAITYPHTNYLCDEGNDPELIKVCQELGVVHVTRIIKTNAKAGNINNALNQATGEICVVLDPDHLPVPDFLDRVLPYFEDPEIGYVQCVQGYYNQSESIIALGAAEQTYHFYGPMMMSMNTYNTVQAIGANCTFRRKALDSIGGHAAGLSEDMHTAMQIHAKGWKSLYVPEMLTKGLVPATLSAFYKQQLKWSRGTFELLFRVYPKLFKNFTWRQKIHYFTIPLYFLFGLVNFIDMLIPLLALGFAEVPWEVNLNHFGMFFLPLCGMSMLIRLYAQRWLVEKSERGLHIAGGILRTATWWIYLVGFIYAIFKVDVPYIPTPKEDEHQNYWKLCVPNILITVICAMGIIYGLSIDWTPYSIAMAFYALINVGMLGFVVILSQQKLIETTQHRISAMSVVHYFAPFLKFVSTRLHDKLLGFLRAGPIAVILGLSLVFLSYNSIDNALNTSGVYQQKEFGGFYSGITLSEDQQELKKINILEDSIKSKFEIVAFSCNWDRSKGNFPEELMQTISKRGSIPMINWNPKFTSEEENESKICQSIYKGKYNEYLTQCADQLRKYKEPVFINFAAGFDIPENSWSSSGNNSPEEFILAWQHVYTFLNNLGISNVTWVWNPKKSNSTNYYPGPKFVDWMGVSCLNYSDLKNKSWYSFAELYTPHRKFLGGTQKPVMITEFGSVAGNKQLSWVDNGLKDIQKNFHEIKSIVMCSAEIKSSLNQKENISDFSFNNACIHSFAENFKEAPFNLDPLIEGYSSDLQPKNLKYKSSFIQGGPGKYKLIFKGEPYYIRGVAYNTAHDWRDGNMPLSRRQVEKDFEKIKAMGANTIRRYDSGIYDKNILNIANEYDLKVLYGFWFDPQIDYYRDSAKVKEYIKRVEEYVLQFKDYPSVLAWSLGNETWGLLKHKYAKPYLIKVRASYVRLIEVLAERIHEIDPVHPIFSCMEHEEYQLPGEFVAFHDGTPSIDVIGVNSYYKEQISHLKNVAYQFDSIRPYLITEFGPRGYWDPSHNRVENGQLVEDSEMEKANWYKDQWTNYVEAFKGYNIGGFAYCWHDRMEGSCTWFGLTDYRGRPKPSYYGLKELWTKQKTELLPDFSIQPPKSFVPGNEYEFSAIACGKIDKELKYEWCLNKDEILEKIDNVESSDDPSIVIVKIPVVPSRYRLYLYVSDESGNVTTASTSIEVK